MTFIRIVIFLLAALILNSCINFKSEYPEINYYTLEFKDEYFKEVKKIPVSMQIRDFSTSRSYNSTKLTVRNSESAVKRLYYHRWISDPNDLITDFLINTYSKYNVFTKGIFSSSAISVPDYMLEGHLIEMASYDNEDDDNYVSKITVKITVIKRQFNAPEDKLVFNKTYEKVITRDNEEYENIPKSFNRLFSEFSVDLLNDLERVIGDG